MLYLTICIIVLHPIPLNTFNAEGIAVQQLIMYVSMLVYMLFYSVDLYESAFMWTAELGGHADVENGHEYDND